MGLYVLLRLVWRPAFALVLPAAAGLLLLLFIFSLDADLERTRKLDLSMIAFPTVLGMLTGQTAHDLRSRLFSWTLPNFQRQLRNAVLVLAAISGLAWTAAYMGLGGSIAPVAACAVYLLIFLAYASVQRAVGLLIFVSLAVVIWADASFGFARAQPAVVTLAAGLGCALVIYVGLTVQAGRKILQAPDLFMLINLFNPVEVARADSEKLRKRGDRPREWKTGFIGTRSADWVRAIEFGNVGATGQLRAAVGLIATFALMGTMILWPIFTQGRSFTVGLEHAFHVFFWPPTPALAEPIFIPLAIMQAFWAWSILMSTHSAPQAGWLYPLSRRNRAQVVYRICLRHTLRTTLLLALTFAIYAGFMVALRGGPAEFSGVPRYFQGVLALIVFMPAAQAARLWLERVSADGETNRWSMVVAVLGLLPFAGATQLTAHFWPLLFADTAAPIQAVLVVTAILMSQGILYRGLVFRSERADLI